VNASLWTLPIEFRWYLAFPIVLWLWTRSRRAFFLVAVTSTAAYLTNVATPGLFVLPAFMLGIVAADGRVRGHRLSRFALPLFPIVALAAALTAQNRLNAMWQMAAFLLVVAGGNAFLNRVLSNKWLVVVGGTSYSIYLVHEPLIAFMIAHGVFAPLAGIAGVGLGFAFWWLAERPFVQPALRERLTAEVYTFLPRWCRIAGIEPVWVLGPPTRPSIAHLDASKRSHLIGSTQSTVVAVDRAARDRDAVMR
jgi:peptidoglycan/LPS O-acetylase OafA/YrhL